MEETQLWNQIMACGLLTETDLLELPKNGHPPTTFGSRKGYLKTLDLMEDNVGIW